MVPTNFTTVLVRISMNKSLSATKIIYHLLKNKILLKWFDRKGSTLRLVGCLKISVKLNFYAKTFTYYIPIQINLELNFKYTESDDRLANNKETGVRSLCRGMNRKPPDLN